MENTTIQIEEIVKEFEPAKSGATTIVKFRNGRVVYGFFQGFEDMDELLEKAQYRFVPSKNATSFMNDIHKTGRTNPIYSIVIDFNLVESIKLIYNNLTLKHVNLIL